MPPRAVGHRRVAFERHLDACPACAQDVRELTETAAGWARPSPPRRRPASGTGAGRGLVTRQVAPVGSAGPTGGRGRSGRCTPGGAGSRRRRGRAACPGGRPLGDRAQLGLLGGSDRAWTGGGPPTWSRHGWPPPTPAGSRRSPVGPGRHRGRLARSRPGRVFVASGLPRSRRPGHYQLWVFGGVAAPGRAGRGCGGGRVTGCWRPVTGDEQVRRPSSAGRGGPATSEQVVVVDLQGLSPVRGRRRLWSLRRISSWAAVSGSGNWAARRTRKASTSLVA